MISASPSRACATVAYRRRNCFCFPVYYPGFERELLSDRRSAAESAAEFDPAYPRRQLSDQPFSFTSLAKALRSGFGLSVDESWSSVWSCTTRSFYPYPGSTYCIDRSSPTGLHFCDSENQINLHMASAGASHATTHEPH